MGHNTPQGHHILAKACRATVSMMAKGSIVAWVLPLRCTCFFVFFTTQLYSCLSNCNSIDFIA